MLSRDLGAHLKKEVGKGVRSFFVFGTLLVTFWSLFLMSLSLFSSLFGQTPFEELLLPVSLCGGVGSFQTFRKILFMYLQLKRFPLRFILSVMLLAQKVSLDGAYRQKSLDLEAANRTRLADARKSVL